MRLNLNHDARNQDMKIIFDAAPKTEIKIVDESDAAVDAALLKVEAIHGQLPVDSKTDFPGFSIVDDAGNFIMGG